MGFLRWDHRNRAAWRLQFVFESDISMSLSNLYLAFPGHLPYPGLNQHLLNISDLHSSHPSGTYAQAHV